LDVRLALRLLVRHIGLTVVGTVAMAFASWSAIVAFEFYTQMIRPSLPLNGGARIVGIVMVDTASAGERSPTLDDFVAWRDAPDVRAGPCGVSRSRRFRSGRSPASIKSLRQGPER